MNIELGKQVREMEAMKLAEELAGTFGQLADLVRDINPNADEALRKARADVQRGMRNGNILELFDPMQNPSEPGEILPDSTP